MIFILGSSISSLFVQSIHTLCAAFSIVHIMRIYEYECEWRSTFCFCYAYDGHMGIKHSNQIFVLVLREATLVTYTQNIHITNAFAAIHCRTQIMRKFIWLAWITGCWYSRSLSIQSSWPPLSTYIRVLGVVFSSFAQVCSWGSGLISF